VGCVGVGVFGWVLCWGFGGGGFWVVGGKTARIEGKREQKFEGGGGWEIAAGYRGDDSGVQLWRSKKKCQRKKS